MPAAVLRAFQKSVESPNNLHEVVTYHYPHFTDKETGSKAQRD